MAASALLSKLAERAVDLARSPWLQAYLQAPPPPSTPTPSAVSDWDTRARQAISTGPDELTQFLANYPDLAKDKYVLLLEYMLEHHSGDEGLDYSVVFAALEANPYFHRTTPREVEEHLSTRELRQERGSREEDKRVSYYDIFVASIQRWQRTGRKNTNTLYRCSIITIEIWDRAKDELWWGGAIYACANFGLETLLQRLVGDEVLGKKVKAGLIKEAQRIQIVFLSAPDVEFTPLGIAIKNQHLDCIHALLTLPKATDYIREGKNVLLDNASEEPVLHKALQWAQQEIGVQNLEGPALHARVTRLAEMLRAMILAYPQLLTHRDRTGRPAYKLAGSSAMRKMFESTDISALLREKIFDLEDSDEVKMALYDEKESAKEIGLDFSDFNHQTHDFEVFVRKLRDFDRDRANQGRRWEFEDTMLYLNLPNLRSGTRPEVIRLFLIWLKGKEVRRIKYLKLPDCDERFDIPFIVEHILVQFAVDRLDWIRLHLNLPFFAAECQRQHVRHPPKQLHVYFATNFQPGDSIGDCVGGNVALPKEIESVLATEVHIALKPEEANVLVPLSPPLKTYPGYTQAEDAISKEEFLSDPQVFRRATLDKMCYLQDELQHCNQFLTALFRWNDQPCDDPWTQHCINVMRSRKVKVALIDNGVDQMRSTLASNIEVGASFVKAGGRTETAALPWFTAADPHGTQMAWLIREANRYCQLYPARVGSLQLDIDDEAAAKAIHWAILQDVDIISISWVVNKDSESLRKAIAAATDRNILVFCSTADTGSHSGPSIFPANYQKVIAVSAASPYGGPRLESCHDVHLMLGGQDIPASGPQFMTGLQKSVTGSSVATALAAGLASLCLFLARMANTDGSGDEFKDRLNMLALLRDMQLNNRDRLLLPHRLFGEGFQCPEDFTNGRHPPPPGLKRFRWESMERKVRSIHAEPFNGSIPRRDRSQDRPVER